MTREEACEAVWNRHMNDDSNQESKTLRDKGSQHYRDLDLQPWDAMEKWGHPIEFFGFLRYCAVKRLARLETKGAILEDLEKVIHEVEKLKAWYQENQEEINRVLNGPPPLLELTIEDDYSNAIGEGSWEWALQQLKANKRVRAMGWTSGKYLTMIITNGTTTIVDWQSRVFSDSYEDCSKQRWTLFHPDLDG